MRTLRVYYTKAGGHYHCRLFTGVPGQTYASIGTMVLDEADWQSISTMFAQATFIQDAQKD